jgi:WD40 repeat protein
MLFSRIQLVTAGLLFMMLLGSGTGWLLSAGKAPVTANDGLAVSEKTDPVRTDLQGDPLPPGAVSRLGTVRFRHSGRGLQGLSFLADRRSLVGATFEGHAIHFWETTTGRLLREVQTGTLSIRAFALSPDAKLIAIGGFLPQQGNQPTPGLVRIIDAASGKEVQTLQRADRDVNQCTFAFTPDGKLLASMGDNGILRIEEIASGVEILQQQFPRDLGHFAMSRDGSTIAVSTGPNTHKLYLWKWQAGEEPRELKVPRYAADRLAFSPDGKKLAAISQYDATVRVWDVDSGRLRHRLDPPGAERYMHIGLAYSPDGRLLTVSSYAGRNRIGALHFWDAATGQFCGRLALDGGSAGRLAISPDSKLIAVATSNGVRVWDLASQKELAANDEAHQGNLGCIAVSTGGLVATASDDHTVRVWDSASGRQRSKLTHGSWVRAIAVSPDGTKLVSSSLDDTVRLWDLPAGRELYRLAGHGEVGGRRAVGFTRDGKRFLSWGDDFYLRVWDVATGKAVREHRIRPPGIPVPDEDAEMRDHAKLHPFGDASFSSDGQAFVLGIRGTATFFDIETGKRTRDISPGTPSVDRLALSPDGKLLLVSGRGKPIETKLTDGRVRYSTANEHPLELWDVNTGKRVRQVVIPGSSWLPIAFSADGNMYAAAVDTPAAAIRLWNTASGEERPSITGFRGRVTALAFSSDARRLIIGLDDSSALVWDLEGAQTNRDRKDP